VKLVRFSTRLMIVLVAVTAGCLLIVRIEPALGAWLLLLAIPAFSWTAIQVERQALAGSKMAIADRLALFLHALFWCVSLIVALLVALLLLSQRFDSWK
jgi:hypothetical protein